MHISEVRRAGVFGIGGYTGNELLRIIAGHPGLELSYAQSASLAGKELRSVYPWMQNEIIIAGREELRETDGMDIAFLCMPAGASMKIVPGLIDAGVRVVDLGPDYRLHPASVFEQTYGMQHIDAVNLENSVYGLPEINRGMISEAGVVANPGCYPTAALLSLVPIAKSISGQVIIDAKSGTSGAGKEPSQFTHHSEIAGNIVPYNVNRHRHIPEMTGILEEAAGRKIDLTFVPHLVPVVRGIEETIYLPGTDAEEVRKKLVSFYSGSPFVRAGVEGSLNMVSGTNYCLIDVRGTADGTILLVFIDNLMKGAGGQAVQNANIMLNMPETYGLLAGPTGVGR